MGISQWKKTVQWRVDDQPHLFTVLIESLSVFRLTTSTYEFHFCLNLFHISLFLVTFVNHLWYAQFFFTQCGEVEFFPTFEVMKKVTINVVGHIDLSFPGGAGGKDRREVNLIPESGRPPGGGNDKSLQYSCLGNPMDRGIWWPTVCGVASVLTFFIYHYFLRLLFITYGVLGFVMWRGEAEFFPTFKVMERVTINVVGHTHLFFLFESFPWNCETTT